jgi:ribonuclease E
LIVIDFIDMESSRNQREVENRLRDALRYDRARVQMGKISRFGLMELSRQRLRPSLGETAHQPCPRCHGTGHIRSIESTALHVLRIIQEEAMKENTAAVHAQVPVDVATFLLNEKRNDIHLVEARLKVGILLIPNIHLETPNYTVARMRHDEANEMGEVPLSYKMVEVPEQEEALRVPGQEARPARPQAAVQGITPERQAPMPAPEPQAAAPLPASALGEDHPSIIRKIFGWFKRTDDVERPATAAAVGAPQALESPMQVAPPAAPTTRTPARGERPERHRRGERSDRGERGERGARSERGERGERSDRPERQRSEQSREQRQRRGEGRRGQDDRRPPRRERDDVQGRPPHREPVAVEAAEPTAADGVTQERVPERAAEGGSSTRSRRRRGRRDRQERPAEHHTAAVPGEDMAASAPAPATPESAAESGESARSAAVSPPVAAPVVAAVAEAAAPGEEVVVPTTRQAEPQPVMDRNATFEAAETGYAEQRERARPAPSAATEPMAMPMAEPKAEPMAEPAGEPASSPIERASETRTGASPMPILPPANEATLPKRFELPPDMVMIETSSSARRQAEQPEAPTDEPSQPRRTRKSPPAAIPDEPLVQIETRK